jgi:ATP-dependent Lon protease
MEIDTKSLIDAVKKIDKVTILETLPVLPVKDLFVFPSTIVPVIVGRSSSLRAISEALGDVRFMLVVPQSVVKDDMETPTAKEMHRIGTLVAISQIIRMPGQLLKVMVHGLEIVNITKYVNKKDVIYAKYDIKRFDIPDAKDPKFSAIAKETLDIFQNYAKYDDEMPPELISNIQNNDDYLKNFFLISSNLDTPLEKKLEMVKKQSLYDMYYNLSEILRYETEVLKYKSQIDDEINEKIQVLQKKFFIKEQIRMLRQELGDDYEDEDNPEIEKYYQKLLELKLPEKAHNKALEEINKLRRTPALSADYSVELNYLDLLMNLPWNTATDDNLDIENAEKVLNEDHYGLEKPKDRILDLIAVLNVARTTKKQIICLVGPPGTGKTSLARSIARALNRKFERIALGGVRDEAEIRGHRRTYVAAMPGKIINAIKKAGSNNPVILLDEIDKLVQSFNGDPASALLEVLDPEQNSTFMDHYLEVEWDLSKSLFITTANVQYEIPSALLDRMEIIEISSYMDFQKVEIAKNHILPKLRQEFNLVDAKITFTDKAIMKIINSYTMEAGVRELERMLSAIFRKITRDFLNDNKEKIVDYQSIKKLIKKINHKIDESNIVNYLKNEKFRIKPNELSNKIGMVNGLAWTSVGGELLPVEVSIMSGQEKLTLTGKLGEVMRESAIAGLTYIRSNAHKLNIKFDFFKNKEIHVHIPEGAIPKDGPSAGITMTIAMLSAITQQYVRGDIAMTGEITLRGNVLPIGGLREKLLAAKKKHITTVIIPKENELDLSEVPEYIKDGMELIPLEHIDEVIKIALLKNNTKIIV